MGHGAWSMGSGKAFFTLCPNSSAIYFGNFILYSASVLPFEMSASFFLDKRPAN